MGIPYDRVPLGVNGASQISGVQKRGAGWVQRTHKGRPCIGFAGGLIWIGDGKIRRLGKSGDIDITGRINRQGLCRAAGLVHHLAAPDLVRAGTAQISQIRKCRIDHQSLAVVVLAQQEADFSARDGVPGIDGCLAAVNNLIYDRLPQSQVAVSQF